MSITLSDFYKNLKIFKVVTGGGGIGDLLAVNNLSDVANTDTSRVNLSAPKISSSTGSPQGVLAGLVGDFYVDTAAVSDKFYVCVLAGDAISAVWELQTGLPTDLQIAYNAGSGDITLASNKPFSITRAASGQFRGISPVKGTSSDGGGIPAPEEGEFFFTTDEISGSRRFQVFHTSGALSNIDHVAYLDDIPTVSLQSAYENGNTIDLNSSDKFNVNSFEKSLALLGGYSINSGGSGYTVGDILTVDGGTGTPIQFRVSIESAGVITQALLVRTGEYTVAPSLVAATVSGGTGSGATFDLTLVNTNTVEVGANFAATGGAILGGLAGGTLLPYETLAVSSKGGDGGFIRGAVTSTQALNRILALAPNNGLFGVYNANTGRYVGSSALQFKEFAYTEDLQSVTLQQSYSNGSTINLAENVPVEISSFEQSAQQAFTLDNPGIGYDVGQILFAGDSSAAKILVEAVNISGEITQAKIIEEGTYTTIPSNPVNVTGGTGAGAAFNLLYQNKNVDSDSDVFKTTGGMIVGRAATLPDYAIADLGSQNVGDNRSILVSTLDNSEETRLLAKSPVNSVFWYNSDISRFRTVISGVAKTILIDDDLTLDDSTGECGFVENAAETVVSGSGVYYKPAGTYIPNELAGFTHLNGVLTYTGVITKKFRISISSTVSLNLVSGSINLAISHNGGVLGRSRQGADLNGISPSYVNISCNSILTLANGDTVSSVVSNETSTDNITVKNLSVSVSSI